MQRWGCAEGMEDQGQWCLWMRQSVLIALFSCCLRWFLFGIALSARCDIHSDLSGCRFSYIDLVAVSKCFCILRLELYKEQGFRFPFFFFLFFFGFDGNEHLNNLVKI